MKWLQQKANAGKPATQLFQSDLTRQARVIAAIPCFNTESSVGSVVAAAGKYVDQVVVIDDGSQDGTAEVAREAGATVVSHGKNRGYGEAIKSCFAAARANGADILVILDGDGQHDPDEIPLLLAPIFDADSELVIGSRFLANGTEVPGYRRFGIRVITMLFNFGSGTKVSDSQSGFRAYTRNLFTTLHFSEKGMSISIEILGKARQSGARIQEVPISCRYASSTISLKAIRHGLGVALSVIRIRFKNGLHNLTDNNREGYQAPRINVDAGRSSDRRIGHK